MSYPNSSPFGGASDSLTEEGMRLLQAGDVNGALMTLQEAVAADPSDGVAFQYLGIARAKTGDQPGSLAALREAARLLPLNAGIQFNLGAGLAQAHQIDEARKVLLRAQELDPQNARIAAALAGLPAQTAPVAPTLGGLGGLGGGLSGLGGLGGVPAPPAAPVGLAAVGGASASSVGALSSVGGGLASVGGGTMDTPPPSAPSNVPRLGPPPSARPQISQSEASLSDSMSSMPASAISARMLIEEPSAGERMRRGLIYGALWAQLWTIWICFWYVFLNSMVLEAMGRKPDAATVIVLIVGIAGFFAFVGAIMGAIAAVIQAEESTGAVIGVVFGLLIAVTIMVLSRGGYFGVVFWFFTGRFIGSQIAARVSRPLNID